MHEWMSDNGNTPHIVVDAGVDGVSVPREHVKDGKIILNISETAAHNLKLKPMLTTAFPAQVHFR